MAVVIGLALAALTGCASGPKQQSGFLGENPSREGMGVGDTTMEAAKKAFMTAGLSISRRKAGP